MNTSNPPETKILLSQLTRAHSKRPVPGFRHYQLDHYCCDASDLLWPSGHWPETFQIEIDRDWEGRKPLHPIPAVCSREAGLGSLGGYNYKVLGHSTVISIFND